MKSLFTFFFALGLFAAADSALAKEGDQHIKVVGVVDVYIPSGFDAGSDAFVVVNGLFPHSCYKLKDADVKHVGPMLHEITTYATVTEGLCLTVLVPFHREIALGKLASGDHQLKFMNGDGTFMEKRLVVE